MAELEITVVSAAGLRDADLFGVSDPYCVCEVAGKRVLTTEVKSHTLDPVWNHSVRIPACVGPLVFSVYDRDLGSKDDLLGTATVPVQSFEGFVPLQKAGSKAEKAAVLRLKIAGTGLPAERKSSLGARLRHVEPTSRTQSRKSSIETVRLRKVEGQVTSTKETHCDLEAVRARLRHVEGQSRAESRKSSLETVRLRHVEGQSRVQSRTSSVERVELRRVERREECSVDVTVVAAKGLRDAGKSEAYCVCEVGGVRVLQTEKGDPVWNRSVRVAAYDGKAPLVFSVMEGKEEVLGSVAVESAAFMKAGLDEDVVLEGGQVALALRIVPVAVVSGQEGPERESAAYHAAHDAEHGAACLLGRQEESRDVHFLHGAHKQRESVTEQKEVGTVTKLKRDLGFLKSSYVPKEQAAVGGLTGNTEFLRGHETQQRASVVGRLQKSETGNYSKYPLDITVVGARGLRDADVVGKSDPFCVCEIDGEEVLRTKVVKDSANPSWNETVRVPVYRTYQVITVKVYDKDTMSADDLLGTVTMDGESFTAEGLEGDFPLEGEKAGKDTKAFLTLKLAPAKSTEVAPSQEAEVEELPLDVMIVGAKNLRDADLVGKSDAYCVCETAGKQVLKTAVVSNSLNPTWNEHALLADYKASEPLVFSVYDKDMGSKDDLLGTVKLDSKRFRQGFEGDVPLEKAGNGGKAFLRLKIAPANAGQEELKGSTADEGGSAMKSLRSDGGSIKATQSLREDVSLQRDASLQSLQFDNDAREVPLDVAIVGVRSFSDADSVKSDPFCLCETAGMQVLKTDAASSNEKSARIAFSTSEPLVFSIFSNSDADELLGTVELDSKSFFPGFEGDVPLEKAEGGSDACLSVKIIPAMSEQEALEESARIIEEDARRCLRELETLQSLPCDGDQVPIKVTIVAAKGLRDAGSAGKSDPFCVCRTGSKTLLKTAAVPKNQNPLWNESTGTFAYQTSRVLEFWVYYKEEGLKASLLGNVSLDSSFFMPDGFEGDVPLKNTGKGVESFITLKIAPVPVSHLGTLNPSADAQTQTSLHSQAGESMVKMEERSSIKLPAQAIAKRETKPPTAKPRHAFHVVGPGPATMRDIEDDSPPASSSSHPGRTFI